MVKEKYVFLDVETTGLNFRSDRIVELGLVVEEDGKVSSRRFLINPKVPIKKQAFLVHGISFDELKGEPEFQDIKDEFLKMVEDAIIVGFNVINFDLPFLNFELVRSQGKALTNRFIDLKVVSRNILENPPNSLFGLSKKLGINVNRLHRALEDAKTTRGIFKRFVEDMGLRVEELESLTMSVYTPKIVELIQITRRSKIVKLKYLTKNRSIEELEVVPIVILKNLLVVENERGKIINLNTSRIIRCYPSDV